MILLDQVNPFPSRILFRLITRITMGTWQQVAVESKLYFVTSHFHCTAKQFFTLFTFISGQAFLEFWDPAPPTQPC